MPILEKPRNVRLKPPQTTKRYLSVIFTQKLFNECINRFTAFLPFAIFENVPSSLIPGKNILVTSAKFFN